MDSFNQNHGVYFYFYFLNNLYLIPSSTVFTTIFTLQVKHCWQQTVVFSLTQNASVLNYLSAEQALADFGELIKHIKQTVPGATKSPVIVVGGSYGGMLATWMRLKYPNLVLGYENKFKANYVKLNK